MSRVMPLKLFRNVVLVYKSLYAYGMHAFRMELTLNPAIDRNENYTSN